MHPLAEALDRLRAGWTRYPTTDVTIRVYAEQLADLDGQHVLDAVNRLLNTTVAQPTIADIRREVAEAALGLPTPEEAWEMALANDRSNAEVERAVKSVGGRWSIKHTNNPETLRAQFRKTYEGLRTKAIRNAAVGPKLLPETLVNARAEVAAGNGDGLGVVSLNGRRVEQLPESTRIRPRPVVWRLTQRMSGRIVPPPTEADMQDAIRILEADREGPEDVLYAEAERVLHDVHDID